jgi:hypothetical protein
MAWTRARTRDRPASDLAVRRASANFWIDVVILAASLITFGTGLVLFVAFHIGDKSATEAFGIGRLAWLNVHRFAAIIVLVGTAEHLVLHGRAFLMRLRQPFRKAKRPGLVADLLLYVAFTVMTFTAFIAWMVVPDSTPLYGPLVLGPLPPVRELWVDIHNLSGLLALVVTTIHLTRRWRVLCRLGDVAGDPPWSVQVAFWWQSCPLLLGRLVMKTINAYDRLVRLDGAAPDSPESSPHGSLDG